MLCMQCWSWRSVLRGGSEPPPLPEAPLCSPLGLLLLGAVLQAQLQHGTVALQQLHQLRGAAVFRAAALPCRGRGALALLLQGKAQGSRWKGQRGRVRPGPLGLPLASERDTRAWLGCPEQRLQQAELCRLCPGLSLGLIPTQRLSSPLPRGLGQRAAQESQHSWGLPHPASLIPLPHLSAASPEPSAKIATQDNACDQQLHQQACLGQQCHVHVHPRGRLRVHVPQLQLLGVQARDARALPRVAGWVERMDQEQQQVTLQQPGRDLASHGALCNKCQHHTVSGRLSSLRSAQTVGHSDGWGQLPHTRLSPEAVMSQNHGMLWLGRALRDRVPPVIHGYHGKQTWAWSALARVPLNTSHSGDCTSAPWGRSFPYLMPLSGQKFLLMSSVDLSWHSFKPLLASALSCPCPSLRRLVLLFGSTHLYVEKRLYQWVPLSFQAIQRSIWLCLLWKGTFMYIAISYKCYPRFLLTAYLVKANLFSWVFEG